MVYELITFPSHIDYNCIPSCEHGPCVLFERKTIKGLSKKFFACSAARNRKICNIYVTYERFMKGKYKKRPLDNTLSIGKRPLESCDMTNKRSSILPRSYNTLYEQFFFTDDCCLNIVNIILELKFKRVISVGCPKIHERLSKNSPIDSFLLDIDDRFTEYFDNEHYFKYNMFNNYFFEERKNIFIEKLKKPLKTLIIIDPPFGGVLSLIEYSITSLINEVHGTTNLIVVMPFFMNKRLKKTFKNIELCDYKIEYSNHKTYTPINKKNKSSKEVQKRASPVRLFTDIDLSKIKLPSNKGYKFCETCKKYVAIENSHCILCNACTTIHGPSYRHCNSCNKCTKPNYIHCANCNKCHLPSKICNNPQ